MRITRVRTSEQRRVTRKEIPNVGLAYGASFARIRGGKEVNEGEARLELKIYDGPSSETLMVDLTEAETKETIERLQSSLEWFDKERKGK